MWELLGEEKPASLAREYRSIRRQAKKTALIKAWDGKKVDPKKNERGVVSIEEKQALAVTAVTMHKTYGDYVAAVAEPMISSHTFYKYRRRMLEEENRDLSMSSLINKCGRPRVYSESVDKSFLTWLNDDRTACRLKTMNSMIKKYRDLHAMLWKRRELVTDAAVRRHLYDVLTVNGFTMQKPKKVECSRVIPPEYLAQWYTDANIVNCLRNIDPRLLFNADETQVCRKGDMPVRVASKEGEQPCCVVEDKFGSHVSLFVIVSATGRIVSPTCILHGPPKQYLPDATEDMFDQVRCIQTANGYMQKDTFKHIINDIFIPHVNRVRESLPANHNKRAALIVDGHISRYDLDTFEELRSNGIDFIILLSHTSHLTQPLDLNLNKMIKHDFQLRICQPISDAAMFTVTHQNRPYLTDPDSTETATATGRTTKRLTIPKNVLPFSATSGMVPVSSFVFPPVHYPDLPPITSLALPTVSSSSSALIPGLSPAPALPAIEPSVVTPSTLLSITEFDIAEENKISQAMFRRIRLVESVQDALNSALTPDRIKSAWAAARLWPFTGYPPDNRDEYNKLRADIIEGKFRSVRPDNPTTGRHVSLVGLVNTEERIAELRKCLEGGKTFKQATLTVIQSTRNSVGLFDRVLNLEDPDGILGDYLEVPEEDSDTIYCHSDLDAYFE